MPLESLIQKPSLIYKNELRISVYLEVNNVTREFSEREELRDWETRKSWKQRKKVSFKKEKKNVYIYY